MASLARKLRRLLPSFPRRRYGIFGGTNMLAEWWMMWRMWLARGPYEAEETTGAYEREFAAACGATHAISFGAGRMALYAILEALDIGEGDEVIIPAFTCVVVPNAILYRGARPVFVDIEPRFFNVDVAKVEAAIGPRTKALYAQHTFGLPCDVEALRELGRRHGLPVIEDGAHALGAVYQGKPIGSLTEVAFFSTDHSKVINTHLGGMAVTSDDDLASRLRRVQRRAPPLETKLVRRLILSFIIEFVCFAPRLLWIGRSVHSVLSRAKLLFYFRDEMETERPTEYPYPCRLSSAQAALGRSQLAALPRNLAHRRMVAGQLEGMIGWNEMGTQAVEDAAWLRYSFLVDDRSRFERAFGRRFDLNIWFTSVVEGRTCNLESVGYRVGSCPVAEQVSRHIVNFPTHPRIPLAIIQHEVERNLHWMRESVRRDTLTEPRHAEVLPN
jgi:perosamine synthetase